MGCKAHVDDNCYDSGPLECGLSFCVEANAIASCKTVLQVSIDIVCIPVQTGAQCTMTYTPSSNIRLTITVTPEVHETFQRIAKAGNMSLSKAMGEWLGDTSEAAQFMADKMEQARSAPKVVMAEMHAYALGLADETGALMAQLRNKGVSERAEARDAGDAQRHVRPVPRSEATPPSSNTGGKGIRKPGNPEQRGSK